MIKETYDIQGMACASCSAAIENVTRKLLGVKSSNVNLATKKMTIEYDESKLSSEVICTTVQKAGFECFLHSDDNSINNNSFNNKINNNFKNNSKSNLEKNNTVKTLILTWIFSLLLMYISMSHMFNYKLPTFIDMHLYPTNFAFVQALLSIVVLFLERKILQNGISALFHKMPNMNSLVAIGSLTSFFYSIFISFTIPFDHSQVQNLFFESSAMVLTFISTGKFLESKTTEKTKSAISSLIALTPDTAFTLSTDWHDGENFSNGISKPINKILVGDLILVKPGERIPLDGIVFWGHSSVDESMLTGESIPIEKAKDFLVTGGSLNLNSVLVIKVTAIGKDTTLAKIISFVEEAQGKKAPISKIADKIALYFVPTVIYIAIIASIIWCLLGKDLNFILHIFTSVLVIACPCALGLATPTAIMAGTGLGAKKGILIRSGEALEICGKIDTVVFDKTGTITKGKPVVTNVFSFNDTEISQSSLLTLLVAVEQNSNHPLAKSILDKANSMKLDFSDYFVTDFENILGKGIKAQILGSNENSFSGNIFIGQKEFILDISKQQLSKEIEEQTTLLEEEGNTVIFVALSQNEEIKIVGFVSISDQLHEDSISTIQNLHNKNIQVAIISGDSKKVSEYIGKQVKADFIFSNTLPEQKALIIEQFQKEGKKVLMVGDGINDSPALVQADVGIAVGNGTDIAIEAADVVLMKSGIKDVFSAIQLSKTTIKIIKENLFWAFFYNTISIPLAGGILFPIFGILLNPMIAGCAMALSSICVVLNALRIYLFRN